VILATQRRFDLVRVFSAGLWLELGPWWIRETITDELIRDVWDATHVSVPFRDVKLTETTLDHVVPQSRLRRLGRRLLRRPESTWRYIELHATVVVGFPAAPAPLVVQ